MAPRRRQNLVLRSSIRTLVKNKFIEGFRNLSPRRKVAGGVTNVRHGTQVIHSVQTEHVWRSGSANSNNSVVAALQLQERFPDETCDPRLHAPVHQQMEQQ